MSDRLRPQLLIPMLGPLYERLNPCVDPLLRVVTGLWLVPHGAQKLFGWWAMPNSPPDLAAMSQAFEQHLGLPGFFAPLAALIEFVGGIMLVLGLLTRPVAAVVFVEFLVIVFLVHMPHGFFAQGGGYEYPMMWGILAFTVAIRGGGRWSLDHAVGREF